MGNKVRIGWVGSGFVGQVAHLANYIDIPEVEIVGLAELRPELGKLVCRKYGIPQYYDNHLALLERSDIDAVVAIVRREHTAPVALDVLTKGVSLFTEKPMAPTVDQGIKLVSVAEEQNCLYVNGFMRRHDEGVQLAKRVLDELTASDELGDVLFLRSYCFGGGDYCNISGNEKTDEPAPRHKIWPMAPDWLPQNLEKEYETFLNVFVHDINLVRYLVGYSPNLGHVDYRPYSGTLALEFREFPGVFEFAHLQTNQYWEEGVEIIFSQGRLELKLPPAFLRNQPAHVMVYKEKIGGRTEMYSPRADWSWAFRRQAEAFVKNLAEHTESIASGEDGLEDLRFVENIWRSIDQ